MDNQQRTAFDQWFDSELDPELNLTPGDKELCRHAWQAALSHAEGEAVGWMCVDENGVRDGEIVTHRSELNEDDWLPGFKAVPVYTHPAPQVAVPEEREWNQAAGRDDLKYTEGWNACRDAMLAAAPTAPQVAGPPLKPGLEWAIAKCRALQNQGFSHTRLDVMIRDLENCLSSAAAAPTAPQVAGWRSGYPEHDGDGGVCHIPLDGHPDFMVVAFNRDGTLVDSCGDDVGYSLEDVERWRPIDAPTAPAGESADSDICGQVELPHVLAWADGIRGDITEYADRITDEEARVAQAVWAAHTGEQPVSGPDGVPERVLMPRALTDEIGAKKALMGEFFVSGGYRCANCGHGFEGDDCALCGCDRSEPWNIPVPWTTIKRIYSAAVDLLYAPAPDEREIAARALDDFKSDVAKWVSLLSDSDPETRVLRKVNGWLHSRAKRLRAGKEGEQS